MGFLSKRTRGLPLAVDIGAATIKILQLKEEPGGIKLHKVGIAPTPYGSVKDGVILDPKAVAGVLQKLLSANQIKERYCVSSFSGQQVIARLVKLPPMGQEEAKQAISYQAEKYIPFPLEQVILDTHILGEVIEQDIKKTAVLLVASQKEAVNSIISTFDAAGLRLCAIDISPFLSLRGSLEAGIFISDPISYEETLLFLDIGASSCDISVLSKGILRFARIIPIGGLNLTRAIATTMNLNIDEAEKTKKEFACAMLNGDVLSAVDLTATKQLVNIITPILSSLLNEIQRSLAYYESKFRRVRISKCIITGGCAKLKNFDKYLARETGIDVLHAKPLQNIIIDNNNFSPDYICAVDELLSVCVGLIFRELKPESEAKYLRPITLDNNFEFGSSRATTGTFM